MPEPKLSPAQFAAKIKSQYPQYKDFEDQVLVEKIIAKYPSYADKVELEVKKKEPSESISPRKELASSLETGSSVSPETQPKKRVTTTAPDGKPVVVEWGPTEFKSSDEAPMDARLSNIVGNVDATIDEATKGKLASAIGVSGGVLSKIIGSAPGKTTGEAIVDAKKFVDNTIAAYNVGALDAQIANNLSDDVPDLQRVAELKKKQKEESNKLLSSKVGQGVGDVFETMATSPATYLTELITTSATRIAGGLGSLSVEEIPLAVGLGIVTGGRGTSGYLSGRNSLVAEMSSRTLDKLEEKGIDVTDPAQLRSAFGNKELMDDIAKEIEAPSSIVAALDVVSAMAAGSLGTPIREMAAQMAAGSAGEAGAQLAESGEITSPAAVITEAIAEIPGGLAEVGFAAKTKDIVRKAKINQQIKDVESQIETAKNPETKDVLLGALNRLREEKNTIYKEFADFANKLSEEDVAKLNEFNQQIVKLNKAIEEVENEDIKASLRDERDAVVAQIAELESKVTPQEDAVQEQAAGEIPVQPEATVSEEVAQGEPQAEPQVAAEEVVVPGEEVIAAEEVSPATQELTEQDLPGFDRMMTELDGVIKKSEQRKASPQKTFENAMNYVVGSKAYESATDVQRESLVRMVNKMFGKREKSAPSVGRLFSDVKDIKNITASEYSLLKNQIQSAARGAREAKAAISKASVEVGKSLKELVTKGAISVKQAAALTNKFSRVNPLNDISVERFVNYATKVFNDAEFDVKIKALENALPRAKKNAQRKMGIAEGVVQPMLRMLSISPDAIPASVLPTYTSLVQMMAERSAVLDLQESAEIKRQTQSVLDAVDSELSRLPELIERFNAYEDKVLTENNRIDFARTLDKMVKDETLSESDAAILRDNRSSVIPRAPKKQKSEEEMSEEREMLLAMVEESNINYSRLPTRDERELARSLNELIKKEKVQELSNGELMNLLRVVDNINNGFLPHYAEILVERLDADENAEVLMTKGLDKVEPLTVEKFFANVKSLIPGTQKPLAELLRGAPGFFLDQMFGIKKSRPIFDSIFKRVAEASERFKAESEQIRNRLKEAEERVFKSLGYDGNRSTMSKFKMMTYLRELEYLSNPGSNQVNPATDFINATIEKINGRNSMYSDADKDKLQAILSTYTEDGAVKMDELYNSFNAAEKNAIKEIQDINAELQGKAVYTAVVIRGDKILPLENYVHLNVMHEHSPQDELIGDAFVNSFNQSLGPSTKAKSLIARTGKVSPINFDVFSSTSRGANYVLMDYYLTKPIRTSRKTIAKAQKMLNESGNPKKQQDALNAVGSVFEEFTQNFLGQNFNTSDLADEAINFLSRQGYRTVLAGAGKFVAETMSNLSAAATFGPQDLIAGTKLNNVVFTSLGPSVMNSVNSKQQSRLYPSDTLSGRLIDTTIMNQAAGAKGSRSKSDLANNMQKIYNVLYVRKFSNAVALLSDALISTPDKLVTRPFWFGAFDNEFKRIAGKEPNYELIANNDEQYMSDNREALDRAKDIADEKSLFIGSTNNAFMGILSGKPKKDAGSFVKILTVFNSYMTTFLRYEFSAARTAIYAMVGQGTITRKQGAQLLAGVGLRMTLYSMMIPMINELIVSTASRVIAFAKGEAYDEPEDEDEKTLLQRGIQALASTISSLFLGRDFGNIIKVPISYGVERFNEKYLDFLRNGEYDPYEDAIMFSQINVSDRGKKGTDFQDLSYNIYGPYAGMFRTFDRAIRTYTAPPKKEKDAIRRAEQEKFIRIPFEVAGYLGFVPLYKDARMVLMNEMYKDLDKSEKGAKGLSEMSKRDMERLYPSLYKQLYGPGGTMVDYERLKREIRKEKELLRKSISDDSPR
jgi:hypothetical protein